jgi:hypothetical protein
MQTQYYIANPIALASADGMHCLHYRTNRNIYFLIIIVKDEITYMLYRIHLVYLNGNKDFFVNFRKHHT